MNKRILKIMALALTIGSLGTVQATPFRKLASYIGAAGYWSTIVALPVYNSAVARQEIMDIIEKETLPICSNYRENILALAHQHGINDLDEATIRQHPYFPLAMAAPHNTIIINPRDIEASIRYDSLTDDAFLGILLHEKRHIDRNHLTYFPVIAASIPFGLHCAKEALSPTKASIIPPSITRSLLRIPLAAALYTLAIPIKLGMFKCLERDADAALKDKPVLARAIATFFRKMDNTQMQDFQEDGESLANEMGAPQAKSILGSFMKFKHDHWNPHPPLLTRAKYLERWAENAETKNI